MENIRTWKDVIEVFEQRISELEKFKDVDAEEIREEKLRGRVRMAQSNLALNHRLLIDLRRRLGLELH